MSTFDRTLRSGLLPALCVCLALAAAAATRAGTPAAQSQTDAERLHRKIQLINENGLSHRPASRRTTVSERELNAYLAHHARPDIPAGIVSPEILIVGGGRLSARAIVDLDVVRQQESERGWLDPIAYLSGRLPIRATGVLHTRDGTGRFVLESAEVAGVTIPTTLLQELVSHYSRKAGHDGLDLEAPFELPSAIREIRVEKGQAVVVQ
jgi:hypothetical protein